MTPRTSYIQTSLFNVPLEIGTIPTFQVKKQTQRREGGSCLAGIHAQARLAPCSPAWAWAGDVRDGVGERQGLGAGGGAGSSEPDIKPSRMRSLPSGPLGAG